MLFRKVGVGFLLAAVAMQNTLAADSVRVSPQQFTTSELRVEVVTAAQGNVGSKGKLKLNGIVVLPPQSQEIVSSPFAGFVHSVVVSPTDTLRGGQLVAQVYSTQMMEGQREFIQQDIQERQALDRLKRSERLFSEGIVSESRVREDRYAHAQAKAAVQERRQTLLLQGLGESKLSQLTSQPNLQAQIGIHTAKAGTVMEVLVSPGQRIEAGAPVLKLARGDILALELQTTPDQSQQIKAGDSVFVAGCTQPGRVRGLASMVRGGNQMVTVHVDISGNCLRPNQAVEAEIRSLSAIQAAFSLPKEAVFQHRGKDYVFVQNEQGFSARPVQVLSREGERVSIGKGLVSGNVILVRGIALIKGLWLGMGEQASDTTGAKP